VKKKEDVRIRLKAGRRDKRQEVELRIRQYRYALIKKKIKFSSYIGKFSVEQLESHL
jgi:hypothetical protein